MAKPPMKPAGDTASDADWQIASQRELALKVLLRSSSPAAVAEVAADLRLSSAMVYRLLAVYRRNPSTSSLLPNRGGRVSGTRLLSTEVETVIQTLISKYYLKRQRPRVADLHRQVILECRKSKLPPPSYKAVWVRVNSVDPALTVRKREGAEAARNRFAPVKKGLAPKRPLELVQIDHTLADIMVVDEVERRSIGRPWLSAMTRSSSAINIRRSRICGIRSPSSLQAAEGPNSNQRRHKGKRLPRMFNEYRFVMSSAA